MYENVFTPSASTRVKYGFFSTELNNSFIAASFSGVRWVKSIPESDVAFKETTAISGIKVVISFCCSSILTVAIDL